MGTFRCLLRNAVWLPLALLCSCVTSPQHQLPLDIPLNRGAGRGDEILATLSLENGEQLLFIVDTGCFNTLLDRSLEPKLGLCFWRLPIHEHYGVRTLKLFRAKKLFVGDTQLKTGRWVYTADLSKVSSEMSRMTHTNRPIAGVLGMDCLKNYCIQLDFSEGKMRFLDNTNSQNQVWGKAFPLVSFGTCPLIHDNLAGIKGYDTLIDTGCNFDGWLTPKLFQQWTNHVEPLENKSVRRPDAKLGGEMYTNVYLNGDGSFNGIGLRFLARHLVTFDFPRQTMYLKRSSNGPLDEDNQEVLHFLVDLRDKGQLPGWSNTEKGKFDTMAYCITGIAEVQKENDTAVYHYTVAPAAEKGFWNLEKAWRTDSKGKIIEELPILKSPNAVKR